MVTYNQLSIIYWSSVVDEYPDLPKHSGPLQARLHLVLAMRYTRAMTPSEVLALHGIPHLRLVAGD